MLKVLFYGQSITNPLWTEPATANLRAKYPNVVFEVRNAAIGGFAADRLERTARRDVLDFYPDLIVFHVYGDHRAYERIIRIFRSSTPADIIVSTDHVVTPVEPVCRVGLELKWSPPPGCSGHFYFRQRHWEDFMSGLWIPRMASKYGLALEPRRERWNQYLRVHRLPPGALLADSPHPNEAGWRLMAFLFTSWFEDLVDKSRPTPIVNGNVQSFSPPVSGKTARYRFVGNRIELIAAGPLAGRVQARIDGKVPGQLDGCWLETRVSTLPNYVVWPAISRVGVDPGYHRPQRWRLSVSHLNASQSRFDFVIRSQFDGLEDHGESTQHFRSPATHVEIEPADWNLAAALKVSNHGVPDGTTFVWSRRFICTDQELVKLPNGRQEQRYVLATGLTNAPHVLELTLAANAPAPSELRAYRPPLRLEP